MKKVLEIHNQGYNCAESILKTAQIEMESKIPVSVGSPFGAGMSSGNTCGAVIGALMLVGSEKGREDSSDKNNSSADTREFVNSVISKFGSIKCMDLKRNGVSCDDIIEYAYDYVSKK